MSTFIAANLTLFLFALVVGLMERTHRHATGAPHAHPGEDTSHDADLQRVLHDLDVHRV
jgi:hypothetical protein